MHPTIKYLLASSLLAAVCACAKPAPPPAPAATEASPAMRMLVFTRTTGYRHDSIPDAVETLRQLARADSIAVDVSEDPADFNPDNLARYRLVAFANTTGDVLDPAGRVAMEAFVSAGGGFIGIHSAADTEYDWPWYGELVGAWFKGHPPGLQTTRVEFDRDGIAPEGRNWTVTDEIYNYRDNPRDRVHVIASVDEGLYEGGEMGDDHPIAWCHERNGGRAWYTGLGHDPALYADATYRRHLARGLRYAAGLAEEC
ncbi:ThuA domain-containing protein [Lysobacter alkalisoli]|uniref:ThuA domain-containing protein n=2 Tax=Marilutibacter alkalisoli TaxID=2591633 RepID=A0A514BRB2_9GAMM|nr:ThuA domain-containing protein [Lysobacter alkalisoli]